MSRLWDKGEALDAKVARFTVGRDPLLDAQLVAYDAVASAAHATMLRRIGILSEGDLTSLLAELREIVLDSRRGKFVIDDSDEDCHTAIENRLTSRIGDAGRRIHTGRSRNDQVIAALRLFARERLLEVTGRLLELVQELLALAKTHRETTVPGHTHTRQAMPSTLGLLFAAHAELQLDNVPWLQQAFSHLDRSPLGSASGYGVALPLDRAFVAELLEFPRVQLNTLAVQNDRGKTEALVLGAVQTAVTDLGRLATDLIWFSSDELAFIKLAPAVTTGSSIMPQKRNPDVLELVRASGARLRQRQTEVGAIYGGLASGYHRDLQLTKEPFVEGLGLACDLLAALKPVLQSLEVDRSRCRDAVLRSTAATDEVYRRVQAGTPFRSAYQQVAVDPSGAVSGDPAETWRARVHLGAAGNLDLEPYQAGLEAAQRWVREAEQRIRAVWAILNL